MPVASDMESGTEIIARYETVIGPFKSAGVTVPNLIGMDDRLLLFSDGLRH